MLGSVKLLGIYGGELSGGLGWTQRGCRQAGGQAGRHEGEVSGLTSERMGGRQTV